MRSFIAAMFLFAFTINAAMLYRPTPAKAVPVASWIKTDKIQERVVNVPLPRIVVRTETIKRPVNHVALPWSCETIRDFAAMHSRKELMAKAREYRLTREQIATAKACIKEARK